LSANLITAGLVNFWIAAASGGSEETGGPVHVAELIATLAANWYTHKGIL
jgi:hypothetical protein